MEPRLTYAEHVYVRTVRELEAANPDGALGMDLGPEEKREPGGALLLKWAERVGRKRYRHIPQALSILGHFPKIPFLAVLPAFLAAFFLFKMGAAGIVVFMSPVLYTVLYFLLRFSVIPFFSRLLEASSRRAPLLLVLARPSLRRHGGLRSLPDGVDDAKVFFRQFGRVFACHPRLYFESFWLVYWLSLSVFLLGLSIFMDFDNMKWEAVQSLNTRTQMVRLVSAPFPSWARPDMRDVAYLDTAYRGPATLLVMPAVDGGKPLSLNVAGVRDAIPLQGADVLQTKLSWSGAVPPDGICVRRKGHWERLSDFAALIPFGAQDLTGEKPLLIAYAGDKTGETCPVQLELAPGAGGNELMLSATPDPLVPITEAPTFLGVGSRAPQYADGHWLVPVDEFLSSASSWGVRLCHGDLVCEKDLRVSPVALAASIVPMSDKIPNACKLKWLSFYLWMILVYGVAPRLLTFGQAAWILRAHRKGLDAELQGGQFRALAEGLRGRQIAVSSPGENILIPLPPQTANTLDSAGPPREWTLIVDPEPGNAFLDRLGRQERHEIYGDRVGSSPRRREALFQFAQSRGFSRIVMCYSVATNPDESVVLFLGVLRKVSGAAVEVRLCAPAAPTREDRERLEHWRAALDGGIDVGWAAPGNPD